MSNHDELEKVSAAITRLEEQRSALGDGVVDSAIRALREQLAKQEEALDERADERKLVTILFCDISGFTALAEKQDPEEVRELINACFDQLVPIVQKYGGTIDKFIGDEIMALFGAPVAHEDDAARALHSALEMEQALAAFNRVRGTSLGVHFGINTGPVVAGEIGGKDRRDYSVMGDAVNLAARLEDASSAGEIFVGPRTHRLTSRLFEFERVAPLRLKGKEEPVEVHRLVRPVREPKSGRGIEGLQTSLIGREAELAILRDAMAGLLRGAGKALVIVGEAGLGKSRLLAEAHALLPPDACWAEGRALSYTGGMSYWLARSVMFSLARVATEFSPSEAAARLRKSIGESKEADLFPYLARMLDLPVSATDEERVKFLSGEALRDRILEAAADYVREQAKRHPLVLVWEDLHWCDPSSEQILQTLVPLTQELPILILTTTRPKERGDDKDDDATVRIRLSPLTREESGSLIRELLRIENLPEHTRELILNRAEGNPFFLEELLRVLIDAGAIVMDAGRAIAAGEIKSFEIPETVQGVLAARIDRLPAVQKQVLQRASIVGRVFQERVLAHLYEEVRRSQITPLLGELQERRFLQPFLREESGAPGHDEYTFQHAITHEVAYGSILLSRRKHFHQLVAEAIEQLFPERCDKLAATLGYHFDKAGSSRKAALYLGRAGDASRANFANTEAIAYYKAALCHAERLLAEADGCENRRNFIQLNEGLGDVLSLNGEQEPACAVFGRALSRCLRDERITRSRLYRKIGFCHSLRRHFAETASAFDEADAELGEETTAPGSPWWEEKVQIQLERMHLFYWQGMAKEMRELAASWRAVIEEQGSPLQRGKFFHVLALMDLTESNYRPTEEGVRFAELAVTESAGSPDLSEVARFRFVLGLTHVWRNHFQAAAENFQAALGLAVRAGDLVIQVRCCTYLAVAMRGLGDAEQARATAERSLQLSEKLRMPEYIAMAKANFAWVAWKEGRDAEAEALAREALNIWHEMEDPYSCDWMALWPLIAIALKRDDVAKAAEYVRALLDDKQNPLAEEVMVACHNAVKGSVRDAESLRGGLITALQRARDYHYL